MIPFLDLNKLNEPYMEEITRAVNEVISSGRYIGGPVNETFEKNLASYLRVSTVVGVSNGLDALTLILRAYIEMGKLKQGDEVIVPANTYVASVLAISRAGLTPVPVEPSAETLNLDSRLIEAAITKRTRAIMPVHLYGRVCWDDTLKEIVARYGLLVIEDNAQGLGSRSLSAPLHGTSHMTGALGDAAALSFYPTKNLGALGDAGAVATNDPELAATVRALANYGSDRRYHNIYIGLNCRLDPIQAAILSVKLKYLDRDNDRRREIARRYTDGVTSEYIGMPLPQNFGTSNFHQFVILTEHRDELRQYLEYNGVATDIHYAVPPHRQHCYSSEFSKYHLPVTERLSDQVVSLPIAPYLTDEEIDHIINFLNSFSPSN
ncbi:MAG: DegT/DnrJ/EryC1/StrS family aminotransferase, partial [Muribaculaceae bacterium]|nr:DegT/DnrJ/EryC1/StrS family aminotransferase [Muribaculaceae bacterium]